MLTAFRQYAFMFPYFGHSWICLNFACRHNIPTLACSQVCLSRPRRPPHCSLSYCSVPSLFFTFLLLCCSVLSSTSIPRASHGSGHGCSSYSGGLAQEFLLPQQLTLTRSACHYCCQQSLPYQNKQAAQVSALPILPHNIYCSIA